MIEREDIDGVAVVRMAHGKANAMDTEILDAIAGTFRDLAATDCRAAVLTGTGPIFSAGVELRKLSEGGPEYSNGFLAALIDALDVVFNFDRPVVAAVNGHAIAGGCVFATACDRRLMAAGEARIGVTEMHAGVPFPLSALEIFRYAVGPARANDLVFTARTCLPDEALAIGLVDEVVPADELMKRAVTAATEMATFIPPATFRLTKDQLHRETNDRIARYRAENDPEVLAVWANPETMEWAKAFVERVTRRG